METIRLKIRKFFNEFKKIPLKDRLGLWLSVLGFLGVIITLYYNKKSLDANNNTANIDTYLKTYAWTIDIDKALVDDPNLKCSLAKDWKTSNNPTFDEEAKATAFAEYMLDIYDAVLNNTNYFKDDTVTEQQWIDTIAQQFNDYPVLGDVFVPKCSLYGRGLNNAYTEYQLRFKHP